MNQELYDKLLEAAILMAYKKGCNDKIAKYDADIQNNLETIDAYKENINRKPDGYGTRKGWGIALIVIGALVIIEYLLLFFQDVSVPGVLVLVSCMFVAIGILLVRSARKLKLEHIEKAEKEYQEAQSRLLSENKDLKRKKEDLRVEFEKMWKLAAECYDFLPTKYQEVNPVVFMLDAVKTLRADTLKEAINLWEAELKWIAEQQQKRQFEAIRQRQNAQMMAALSEIESNQEQLNSNLRDIKVMQYIDYYNKQ